MYEDVFQVMDGRMGFVLQNHNYVKLILSCLEIIKKILHTWVGTRGYLSLFYLSVLNLCALSPLTQTRCFHS